MESLLFPAAGATADRLAVRVGERALDHAGLTRGAGAHARALARRGVAPGERVGVVAHPSIETVVAFVGNALHGAVSVPIAPKLGARDLGHVLGDAAPAGVLSSAPDEDDARLPGGAWPIEVEQDGPVLTRGVDARPLFVLYTSGTTGAPKGAVLSAASVAANLDALAEAWAWTASDTVVHALPLFHVHGLVLGLFGSLRRGGALDLLERFDPLALAARLEAGGTMLFAVPTMYHRLVETAEREPAVARALAKPRLLVSGSAPLSLREHRRVEAIAGRGVHERYGLTETLIATGVRADAPPRPGYVGGPLPGVELRLVDDARAPIDASDDATLGEVAIRGPSVFSGYLNRPDATEAVLDRDGWFYTGDLATRAPDGAIRIHGRRSTDLVKTGGFKVGAGEVEACLLEDPGVREVAVVGVPDDDLGERIEAFVVPVDPSRPPDAAGLADRVARALAPHKRPRAVHFVDALPRNAMGKVQKTRLRGPAS